MDKLKETSTRSKQPSSVFKHLFVIKHSANLDSTNFLHKESNYSKTLIKGTSEIHK